MNATSSHRTKPSNDLDPHAMQIQPQDLNALINGLKSREENLIELFDRNLKYRITKSRKELAKLQAAATQYITSEEERQQLEDRVVNKYLGLQASEEGQIKLMHKLFKRVSQLTSHAKKKLVDLGIFEQTRNTWELAQENERNLRSTLLDIPIDVESVFISIIDNSRQRFSHGILALEDVVQSPTLPMQSGRRTTESGLSTTPKPLHDNGIEYENRNVQGQESNRGTKIKRFLTETDDLTKNYALKNGLGGKHGEGGMAGDNKAVPLIMSMQAIRNEVSFSCLFKKDDSTINPRLSIEPPEMINKTPTYKTDYIQKIEPESRTDSRATGSLREKVSASRNLSEGRKTRAKSRSEYVKPELLPTQPPSNLPLIRQTARKSIILKKSKSNFDGELEIALKDQTSGQYFLELTRNYDLLKLEPPFNLPSMPKKLEERKAIMERVYNDLFYMNQRIKKTIVQYQLDHLSFFNKKKTQLYTTTSQKSTPKNESRDSPFLSLPTHGLHKSNSLTPVGGERPKSTYLKKRVETEPNSADLKLLGRKHSPPKGQNPNLPQRPLMSRETKTLQITFRPEQEVAGIQKITASPPRRNLSPARAAGFGIRTSVTESGQRTKSMKDIKIKMVKTTSLGDSEDLIIDGTQLDKQRLIYMTSTSQTDMYKVPREPGGRSMGSSPIGQGNMLRPKAGSTQSTASILAKINEEHVLNKDLMNKRYHF